MYIKRLIYLLLFFGGAVMAQTPIMMVYSVPSGVTIYDSVSYAEVLYFFENNVADSSGNAVDGTYAGTYDATIYKQGSYAVEFESSDVWDFDDFTLNDTFDIAFWYYHESAEAESYAAYLARRGSSTNGWSLEFDQINGDIEFHKFVSGTDYEARTVNNTLQSYEDSWAHIVIQIAGPTVGIYIDNVDKTYDGTTTTNDYQTGTIDMGTSVNSTVDAYQIYNFNATSTQRKFLLDNPGNSLKYYPSEASPPPPAGDSTYLADVLYLFENNVADSSGNGVDGTYSGAYDATYYIEGSYAVEFEATDLWTMDAFTLNDTFAISLWWYHESAETEQYQHYIAKRGTTTNGWSFEADLINEDLEFHKFISGVDYEAQTDNGSFDTHDEWVHIILQVAGAGATIYTNNVSYTNDFTTAVNDYQTGQIVLGTSVNSTIDNWQIYNILLTEVQRTFLFNNPTNWLKIVE